MTQLGFIIDDHMNSNKKGKLGGGGGGGEKRNLQYSADDDLTMAKNIYYIDHQQKKKVRYQAVGTHFRTKGTRCYKNQIAKESYRYNLKIIDRKYWKLKF